MIGVGINLFKAGVLGGDAGVALGVGSDLQRLLALSPSALWWPQQGAGWQGTSGGTLAASGQPVGLLPDLAALEGKTLAEWLASAPELVTNGGFDADANWGTLAGATISGGQLVINNSSSGTIIASQAISGAAELYVATITQSGYSSGNLRLRMNNEGALFSVPASNGTHTVVVLAPAANATIQLIATGATTLLNVDSVSLKALPGNHLRAGTWPLPADSSRALLTADGALNFDGSNDYYSLLNAISITENMTVVRAFKRSAAGIRSTGLSAAGADFPHDLFWQTDNGYYLGLGGSSATTVASTATGSFVSSSLRNTTTETVRLNGASAASRSSATVTSAFSSLGFRGSGGYNSGEISFLAVFDRELTGADLALVEQIAAATNGATLV